MSCSSPFPTPGGGFVHPLLRARDWQDRPEFQTLCQWWKDGGAGVCALVGIGGAGKTAIAERFLQVLPGGYPEHPRVPKDRGLAAPARLFVFSFYDAANPDRFFAELAAWLEDRPPASMEDPARLPSYYRTLELLGRAGRCLLVLDGLEKVQDDGSRGGAFGQILDGRLRDFILRVADGWLPPVSLVITSRFRLYDPLASRTWYYRQIEVEELLPSAAVQLLRDRGVRETEELEAVAREQGFHALSVDLVGGYIAHFCGGDPKRFTALTPEPEAADPALDPRIAAIREQERKFARLAERYHQALAGSDPAALALLQRVCLFRLGVDARTLASIFTGAGKESIAGPALAGLNEEQLLSKLQLLVEMRLVQASRIQGSAQPSRIYKVHPAVRAGFLKGLDAETARRGHDAAREGLEASLGGLPNWGPNPSDPATLDLLEEIVYHTLAAGRVQEAYDIYENRIGGYENLGWRLGSYARGERICRAFAAGPPTQSPPFPAGLSEEDRPAWIGSWGLFLQGLGQLEAAAHCFERQIGLRIRQEHWRKASVGNQNLAKVLLLAGRLAASLRAAEEALRLADLANIASHRSRAHSFRAHASALRGDIPAALAAFRAALEWQHIDERDCQQLYSLPGLWHAHLLDCLERREDSTRLTETNKIILRETAGPRNQHEPLCDLLLADLARERSDPAAAREHLRKAYEWALQRDAKEPLCWSALVRAKIELSTQGGLSRAASALEEGLRIARECGYGIFHIDLLLVRAQLALREGRAADAERDVRVALDEGVYPPVESGFPELLAATDPECLYAWGIAAGRQLLAEALLLQAAQKLGQPKQVDRPPADVRDLIDRAREEFARVQELWRKLRDPESDVDIHPRGERTKCVLEGLESGLLTDYPLESDAAPKAPRPDRGNPRPVTRKKHVFLSYCHDNQAEVAKLHDDLIAAGEAVWWDQDLLPGQDWKLEIRKAMRNAYAVVLCLSEETAHRITSGIYPEVLDAIAAYREYAPGSVFLIPVRLSDCEIPLIEIDATRTLDRLQFVDLFPPDRRRAGLERLLKALQAAPFHP